MTYYLNYTTQFTDEWLLSRLIKLYNDQILVLNKYSEIVYKYNGKELTDAEVEEIKLLYKQGKEDNLKDNDPTTKVSYRKLAEQYGVSHTLIKDIINGKHRNKDNYIMK